MMASVGMSASALAARGTLRAGMRERIGSKTLYQRSPFPVAAPVLPCRRAIAMSSSASSSALPAHKRSAVSNTRTESGAKGLPKVPNPYPLVVFTVLFAIASWTGFTTVTTNSERLSSSIFKDVVVQIKTSPRVQALLLAPHTGKDNNPSTSEAVRTASRSPIILKHEWWLAGSPYVRGTVGMMKGRIDLSFKITTLPSSSANAGPSPPRTATVYFTSIRATKEAAFEIIRFLVVQDDEPHSSVSLLDSFATPSALANVDAQTGDIVH